MAKPLQMDLTEREIARLTERLEQSYRVIWELIGALDCQSEPIRSLVRDTAVEYIKTVKENEAKQL